ncbi:heavy metal translocating P-type ATPase [Desulfococcaceae bacterium HSG8]|nr:heavy metal translocating P-type ATPase [Desulfococcaceae bacterium HSG8]
MFIEVCLISCVMLAASEGYKKIRNAKIINRIKSSLGTEIRDTTNKIASSARSSLKRDSRYDETKSESEYRTNELSNTQIDKCLALTSVSTALTAAGKIFYPPLVPIGLLALIYPFSNIIKRAYEGLFKKHKITVEFIDSILLPGMILTGYYFISCFVFWLYYLSMKLLNKIEDNTRQNFFGIFENQPCSVWIVINGVEVEVPFDSLHAGDIAVVGAGEIIPADGIITEGIASVDQHILTGESQPLEKGPDEPIFASTLVLAGKIRIRVEKSGQDTLVGNIANILKCTVDFKSTIQSKGEIIAERAALPTLAAGVVALPLIGPVGALAVLNCYIGDYIRILAPLSTLSFLKTASMKGILIKDGRSLELLGRTDTVVFDKTGTLTLEQLYVRKVHTYDGYNETRVLKYAVMAEKGQSHPIARAILEKADECEIAGDVDDARYEIGYGISVRFADKVIRVGSARFMEMEGIQIPGKINDLMHCCHDNGHSLVMVSEDKHLAGAIELHSVVRPEARDIIARLRKRGKSLYMITGDHQKSARILAEDLGIKNYFAETFPEQKAQIIADIQRQGRSVCFIGDGINDSIAMKKAHVSVSLSGASTVATDTANIILMDGTLNHLDSLFGLARDFDRNVSRSLAITVAPGLINTGCVFLLHTGIYFSVTMEFLSLPAGIANSFLPLTQSAKETTSGHNADPVTEQTPLRRIAKPHCSNDADRRSG